MSDNENFEALNPECKDSDVQSVKSTQSHKSTVLSAPTLNVSVTSGRQSPVHSDVDETGSVKSTRSSKRAQSPARLPDELVLKARSQINRVKALTLHFKQINNFRDKDSSAINNSALNALALIGQSTDNWDCLLVYSTIKQLSSRTGELWESSVSNQATYPTYTQLKDFISQRARTLENTESACQQSTASPSSNQQNPKNSLHATARKTATQPAQQDSCYQCDCCFGAHFITSCQKFRTLSPQDRHEVVIQRHICKNCMGRHNLASCKSSARCKICNRNHHSMLHEAATATTSNNSCQSNHSIQSSLNSATHSSTAITLLATAKALIITPIQQINVRILIDSGSEISLVSEHLITQASIKRRHSSVTITGIGGKNVITSKGSADLILKASHSDTTVQIVAQILPILTVRSPSSRTSSELWTNPHHIKLADPSFFLPQPVDIIIGADFFGRIIKPNIIRYPSITSIAQLSIFGWLIIGPAALTSIQQPRLSLITTSNTRQESNLDELLTRFWIQEEVPEQSVSELTPEEEQCETHFKTTHQRDQSGGYIVRLPVISEKLNLGNSYNSAHRRLQQISKKLNTNQEYKQLYTEFMQVYEVMGHMTAVSNTPTSLNTDNDIESADFTNEMTLAHDTSVSGGLRVANGESAVKCHQRTQSVYYLPHHGVLRPDSVSTKLRVVFDGSCVTSSGKSLNDFLHIGAKIQLDITDVLLYVRQHQYIVSTDIEKMFRKINVHPDDWDLQRILWFNNNEEIMSYHLTTVTYGTRSAPFLDVRVLQQLVEDEGKNYPLAVPALKYGRYVDDIFGGADNTSELKAIANQLKQICTAGGFPLAKWQSSSEEVLNFISPAGACDEPHQLGDCTSKLLGLYWHNLRFIMKRHSDNQNKSSKRSILSEVAQIFDPLGFLSPLTIKAKMLLQELWLQKIGWDHQVPSKVLQSWQSLQLELQQIDTLNIPRWINTSKVTNYGSPHAEASATLFTQTASQHFLVQMPHSKNYSLKDHQKAHQSLHSYWMTALSANSIHLQHRTWAASGKQR
ncbi:uncharacterized protein LOC125779249 [Bactrocera dorsalis]|uniref:Uncharacterized protein LOC125779249 n=1 Tax=Bactrocera dorsalis TaxID=27457 RepID=A0ABM3K2Z5_BACDO|nr:uncharacterized protein LOC125779249 [Bactrocera dorsalis]